MGDNITFNTREAAEYLGVSFSTIRRRMDEKAIPFYRVGIDGETGDPRFRKSALDRYIEDQEQKNYQK